MVMVVVGLGALDIRGQGLEGQLGGGDVGAREVLAQGGQIGGQLGGAGGLGGGAGDRGRGGLAGEDRLEQGGKGVRAGGLGGGRACRLAATGRRLGLELLKEILGIDRIDTGHILPPRKIRCISCSDFQPGFQRFRPGRHAKVAGGAACGIGLEAGGESADRGSSEARWIPWP